MHSLVLLCYYRHQSTTSEGITAESDRRQTFVPQWLLSGAVVRRDEERFGSLSIYQLWACSSICMKDGNVYRGSVICELHRTLKGSKREPASLCLCRTRLRITKEKQETQKPSVCPEHSAEHRSDWAPVHCTQLLIHLPEVGIMET